MSCQQTHHHRPMNPHPGISPACATTSGDCFAPPAGERENRSFKALSGKGSVPAPPPPFRHTPFRPRPRHTATVWRNLGQHPHRDGTFTFSAKERDSETGLSYFGSRYYSSDLSIWLSVDPMAGKYPSLSPYVYCADNPVKLVDPNGETFVGVDGENVEVNQEKNGKISVGNNASDDLKRMASMINESGSKTAARQFMRLSKNECKIHFQIIQDDGNGGRLGYHQAHGENGNPLDWNDEQGTFSEMPSYINNTTYKEATITIFENVVAKSKGQFSYQDNKTLTLENAMVVVFAHEAEHNLNKLDILSIKYAIMGGGDNLRNVEKNAERIEKKTLREIYYAK